jgi:putative sigma-54 modulation protein
MQIAVTFRHMAASESAKDYVKDKVEKLEKFLENPQEVHVVLSTEKFRHIAEITLVTDGLMVNSQASDNDLYAAIDNMVDKMDRQIRERKGKERRKRTNQASPEPALAEAEETEGAPPIRRRRAFAKPMSAEEAIAQFNLSEEDLFFFINSASGQMNVLCRNKEGGYDWVEPQPG